MNSALRSTSFRLALAVSLSFFLAITSLGAGVYFAVSTLLDNVAREVVRADAAGLSDLYRQSGHEQLLDEIRDRVQEPDDPDAVYALLDADGNILAGNFSSLPRWPASAGWVELRKQDGNPRVIAMLQRLSDNTTLLTGVHTRSQDGFLALMLRTALAGLIVAALVGAVIGWLTLRWVGARLHALDATAAQVGEGKLGLRVHGDGSGDAFDRVARRFNAMLDRIETLIDGVRHATDHIAHDLRTPLTRLRNRLDALRRRKQPIAADELDEAIDETDQLLQSFSALLRLSRIEAQPPATDEPLVQMDALARDAMELYAAVAGERGITLLGDFAPAAVHGDADQLFQALVNLLDNAIKFSPDGGEVSLQIATAEGQAVVRVRDAGPGIAENDHARVFDRFERLDAARHTPGTGLGLSLVRAIVLRHGGNILLQDGGPGLVVQITLPQAAKKGANGPRQAA